MKLLTLNTHSLVEENHNEKLEIFLKGVLKEKPDVIALQEVNQSVNCEIISATNLPRYFSCDEKAFVRADNHLLTVIKLLEKAGLCYYWTYAPIKKGYPGFEEGIGLMSLSPIEEACLVRVSSIDDYENWRRRKIIGIRTEKFPDIWFYSVHYGWWNDREEPFVTQWENTLFHISTDRQVWLMGDFNSPPDIKGESYDLVQNSGCYDSFTLAEKKDSGITVGRVIDGWQDKIKDTNGMRIDQLWCNKRVNVKSSTVIFNKDNYGVVSDHYGVLVEI